MRKNPIRPQKGLTISKASLIARMMGDGAVYRHKHDYVIKYEVKDLDSLRSFAKEIKEVYGLTAKIGSNPSGKTGKPIPYARLRCKDAYEDLARYGRYGCLEWRVPRQIRKGSRAVQRAFLRSFFDDEGSVLETEVRLYSTNLAGLKDIVRLLRDFRIETCIRGGFGLKRNVHAIIIKKENARKFSENIGFGLKRKNEKLLALLAKVCP